MQAKDLIPASRAARRFGVKAIGYGPPGSGKTPIFATAPKPVLLAVEPGLLSMRNVNHVPVWEAHTPQRIDEFFNWFFSSHEAKQFDTLGVDSVSQMAEIYLELEKSRNKDGRAAYGKMSETVMKWINQLYFMPDKHIYLIGKQGVDGGNTRPYFPGQDLNVRIPHLFDEIFYIAKVQMPGMPNPVTAIRTQPTFDILARDRSGLLAELEPPNLSEIFAKAMQ